MTMTNKRLRALGTLAAGLGLIGAVALGFAATTSKDTVKAGGMATIACPTCRYQANHQTYQVMVTDSDAGANKYSAGVMYDTSSAAGINAYVQANKTQAPTVFAKHATLKALVTFARPLSFDEFRKLMGHSGITVESFGIRGIDPDGTRSTIFGKPKGADIAGEKVWQDVKGNSKFKGFFSANATLNAGAYGTLTQSADVYLVDIMDAAVRDEVTSQYSPNNVQLKSPYWDMEDLGMVK